MLHVSWSRVQTTSLRFVVLIPVAEMKHRHVNKAKQVLVQKGHSEIYMGLLEMMEPLPQRMTSRNPNEMRQYSRSDRNQCGRVRTL